MSEIFTNDYANISANKVNIAHIPTADISATDQRRILITPSIAKAPIGASLRILDVVLVTETTDAIDATNYWSFQVKDITNSNDLLEDAVGNGTGGTAITADTPYKITPDQNNVIDPDSVIELDITKHASADTLSACSVLVVYDWVV